MSPAGYWPQLHAAIDAGADACYFGLKHFTARAKTGFDLAELPDVMKTLHARGVRGFLTFNTLVFQHELTEAARVLTAAIHAGVDTLIIQDIGMLRAVRAMAPSIEIHASTQTSITDVAGVKFALEMGADRVTLARELSIEEIATIHKATQADLEIFVHGALCVAYSGQCFSSEAWGGRSANRGQCAQACRLPYELEVDGAIQPLADARYLLSPGDLYGLKQVPEIVAAGVSCLKIEGRYKDAGYVALTTRAYREAIDAACTNRPLAIDRTAELEQVYSRGLGPYFLTGVNHQAVVNGRAPRHRGLRAGTVTRIANSTVQIEAAITLKPGDGVVFDAASWRNPSEKEEGGRIYSARPALDGTIELTFANGAIDFTRIREGDLLWRTHDPDIDKLVKALPVHKQRIDIDVHAEAETLTANWRAGRHEVTTRTPTQPATNRALDATQLRDQLGRLGNTSYELGELTAAIDGAYFVPVSALNAMRREAVEELTILQTKAPEHLVNRFEHETRTVEAQAATPQVHVLVRTPEQLDAAIDLRPASITLDYLDLYGLRPSVDQVKRAGITVRVASPRILKPAESRIVNFLADLDCPILIRATSMIEPLKNRVRIGDFSLNTANDLTAEAYLQLGVERLTPTHDLNAAQISDLATRIGPAKIEAIAYQHLPVFHTEHCVFCRFLSTGTTYRDCGRPCEKHRVALKDDHGRAHPVMADVGCRNTVFGAEAQQAAAHMADWLKAGIHHFRLEFVHENAEEVRAITSVLRRALDGQISWKQLAADLRRTAPEGITEGSLFVARDYKLFPILQ
ncbi:MAG: U32 family peptidase [Acidobacteria bacterium]|nr:U32 family peptidase [Acidobacteriota bacterium]